MTPSQLTTNPRIISQLKRVMILDSRTSAKILTDMLRNFGARDVFVVTDDRVAMDLATDGDPQIIFCDYVGEDFKGIDFIKAIRRSDLSCRQVPVIMSSANITKSILSEVRNAGIDELMAKPFSQKDVQKRLEAVFLSKRPWIEGVNYIGPDRRRFNASDYSGAFRRKLDRDSEFVQIEQAVKLLNSAVEKLDSDPHQAMRSMLAQLELLVPRLKLTPNLRVRGALSQILAELKVKPPRRVALEPPVSTLLRHFQIVEQKPSIAKQLLDEEPSIAAEQVPVTSKLDYGQDHYI